MTNPQGTGPAGDWAPRGIDTQTPSVARMYDYYLGGKHHYAADREAAARAVAAFPQLPAVLKANRAFLARAVRFMAEAGIGQFLDLGTGLPTQENVHQVAQAVNPAARVAYVDNDPVTLAHARALLATDEHTTVADADLRHPEQVLDHPEVTKLLDFDQPIGLLLVMVMHFVPDDADPAGIIARYRDALAPGSYFVTSLADSDSGDPEAVAAIQNVYRNATAPLVFRPRAQLETFLAGFELVEPGLVEIPDWRPASAAQARAERAETSWVGLAAVGHKP